MTGTGGCGELRVLLGAYLVGAISPADRDAVTGHLRGCARCREELAGLAALPGLMHRVPEADASRLQDGDPPDSPAPA